MSKLSMIPRLAAVAASLIVLFAVPIAQAAEPVHVQVQHVGDGYALFCDRNPFFIQGAGGDASLQMLKDCGGNSVRLWGTDHIEARLAEANRLGLKVAVGIWLEHTGGPSHFSYRNPEQVAKQFARAKADILKYKDNPAVLLWGIGNEMEGEKGDDPAIWAAVQDIAAMAHKLDPNHPTMTVTAELGGKKVESVNKYCPDIDIMGINSYGGAPSVAKRYRELGGVKPYIITEFGPAGPWECAATAWKAPIELTSTQKADSYRNAYEKAVLSEKGRLCIGSYAFLWGHKQEATATWFGMFLPDGGRLGAVDAMLELWTGQPPASPCPKLQSLKVNVDQPAPGTAIHASLDASDPMGRPLTAEWVLTVDPARYITGGFHQESAQVLADAVVHSDLHGADIHMPARAGGYWLYAYVRNDTGGAATAVVSLNVHTHQADHADANKLPLKIYGDGKNNNSPYAWSGWMGDTASIAVDDKCLDHPHSGPTCMKCQFKAASGFGAVAGQSPANDWGDQPGGLNLTGANQLTFWARGEEGGEQVSFKVGILGPDKKFCDSDHAELPDVTLTNDWKQYRIDLQGKDLARIKTGFVWVVVAHGKPVTFYLDDIQYE